MKNTLFTILILSILLGGAAFTVYLEHHFNIPKSVGTMLGVIFVSTVGILIVVYSKSRNKPHRDKTIEDIREEKINKIIKRF